MNNLVVSIASPARVEGWTDTIVIGFRDTQNRRDCLRWLSLGVE